MTNVECRASRGGGNGGDFPDTDWMTRTDPWELLGVAEGSSADEIKAAFRAKIKNVHPDVYRGELDAEAITTRLVLAYELLLEEVENPTGGRRHVCLCACMPVCTSLDVNQDKYVLTFESTQKSSTQTCVPVCMRMEEEEEEEEEEDGDLWPWVNEIRCLGQSCRSSCIVTAPFLFSYAEDTARARAMSPDAFQGWTVGGETKDRARYCVNLAVGQCPELCIHYVTSAQHAELTGKLQGIIDGMVPLQEGAFDIQAYIAKATYDNNRRPRPKRRPKAEGEYVDCTGSGPNTVTLVIIRLLVGIAQGFIFPAIHTVLAQWTPPHEKSRAVSLSMSGMYLGAGIAMQILPGLVASRGPESVFQLVAAMGVAWTILWIKYASDPPGGPTAFAHVPVGGGMGGHKGSEAELLPLVNGEGERGRLGGTGAPVWAIVANNFTFHYALYVLMNWLPTYFHQALNTSLHNVGSGKAMPYYIMTLFSNVGGVLADHLIAKRYLTVGGTRKVLNTIGFFASAVALALTPVLKSVNGAVLCSSLTLGACAIARAGFAVNHMDIAPRFAGVVMGVSNTAGTMAGVVGVAASGLILEAFSGGEGSGGVGSGGGDGGVGGVSGVGGGAAGGGGGGGIDPGWWWVFFTPASLCVVSALIFDAFATGERVFE
ncbi:unnamed protein product [Closterium sp. Yama58-4]|nr:unnamed protein product [Closterium sp. Yama58-4]